jgi:capsular exopolysaccharide synthesis family protein
MIFNDPEISKVKSVGLAPEPLRMSFPNIKIFLPAGFMLGFMLGVALAFAIELLNDLLRTPNDVMKYLRVPLLGTIYHADQDEYVEGIELCHVVRQAPYSIISESYRQFRINLKLSGTGDSKKILLITSGKAGEGKTSVATNMAATLIAEDRKVLLIDTNFRKPSTPTLFPLAEAKESTGHPDYGLSNYLMGQCRSEDIIRTSGIAGLDIIDSGPLPSNPAEILDNPNMGQLLDQCRRIYDYVIIDSPPLLVSEAKILAAQADGTILVFNTDLTKRGAAQRILRELHSINADIIGCVLIGVRAWKGGYFQEVYKSYQQYQQAQLAQPI